MKKITENNVNTIKVITSCNTLSCQMLKGPPFSLNPILLAGTWKLVFKECYRPANKHDASEAYVMEQVHLLKLQVAVPCESHERIREDEEKDCLRRFVHG